MATQGADEARSRSEQKGWFWGWLDDWRVRRSRLYLARRKEWQLSNSANGNKEILVCLYNQAFVLTRDQVVDNDGFVTAMVYTLRVGGKHHSTCSLTADNRRTGDNDLPCLMYHTIMARMPVPDDNS